MRFLVISTENVIKEARLLFTNVKPLGSLTSNKKSQVFQHPKNI